MKTFKMNPNGSELHTLELKDKVETQSESSKTEKVLE